MKQIDFRFFVLDESMISAIVSEVAPRLTAPESDLDISLTLWPLYKACAASIMVGVGLYIDSIHSTGSKACSSLISSASCLMCETKLSWLDFIG